MGTTALANVQLAALLWIIPRLFVISFSKIMNTKFARHLIFIAILSIAPLSTALAETASVVPPANLNSADSQESSMSDQPPIINDDKNWYFSWGYSRQYYAPSDIHISQPSLGNDFTVHKAKATDFHTNIPETLDSIAKFNFFAPQENIRIGKFMDAEKSFDVEFSLDHSKYNTTVGQTALVTGTIGNGNGVIPNGPVNSNVVLDKQTFDYALHNGLNHIMVNAVWLHHLYGPKQKPGDLESISRVGAGILLPHAVNTIFGNKNQVGPKWVNSCCLSSNDWWQLNGWTVGVEVGVRYRLTQSLYLEATLKEAYGELRKVPVYQGTADQVIWMTEGVMSLGYLF